MALSPPTDDESLQILESFCYVDKPALGDFAAFLDFYRHVACREQGGHFLVPISPPALNSHRAVTSAASMFRSLCNRTKKEDLLVKLFPGTTKAESERCLRITTKLAVMVDCASRNAFSVNYRLQNDDTFPAKWRDDQTFVDFFHCVFPTYPTSPFRVSEAGKGLKAWKLLHRHHIQIVPTNDLVEHLVYNKTSRTISVFHQVAYLKEQIRHSPGTTLSESVEESLKRGTLPPQLLFETLYSIYYILFPHYRDKKSAKLAKKLIKEANPRDRFDPNLNNALIKEPPDDFQFIYWSKRLRVLKEIVTNPPPTNKLIAWVERHVSERNVLTIAIIGLFLTAFFGLLGFLVGIAQLVVAILTWKYPV